MTNPATVGIVEILRLLLDLLVTLFRDWRTGRKEAQAEKEARLDEALAAADRGDVGTLLTALDPHGLRHPAPKP